MSPERLLKYFDQIAEAPDAVARLRRFILDLAVRGKLVEQDPKDGSASKLLDDVRKLKLELLKERDVRGERDVEYSTPVSKSDIPFSWEWVHVNDVAIVQGGKRLPPGASFSKSPTPYIYIRVTDMKNGTIIQDDVQYITHEVQRIIARYTINQDDLYITIAGTIGQVGKVPGFFDGHNLTENAAKIVFRGLNPDYLYLALSSDLAQQQFREKTKQMAQPKLALKRILGASFPLPPLAEQHRIVAKVDELMTLCDKLEAARAKRESRRDRLVVATLHALNNGDATSESEANPTFKERARFYFNHLPRLTTRPEHIKQLRQAILNIATKGKLVEQDPNDTPALELMQSIQAEKMRMVCQGVIKKEKFIEEAEMPFRIPKYWVWVRLSEISELITKGSSPKWQGVEYVSKDRGVLFITSENVDNYRLRKLNEPKYVEERFNQIEPRSILHFGDLLMNLVGASIGRTAVYDIHEEANINQAVALIRLVRIEKNISTRYLLHYFNSPFAIKFMLSSQVVTAQPNMSLTDVREFPIPLPPLAEQHRIVAKVDELMGICDELETRLTAADATRRQLLESTLQEALAP